MDFIEGEILAFDKPLHWTSFDVVGKTRWLLCHYLHTKKLKVGHTGTLDPLATGVVIVCTGHKTKLISQLQYDTKEYLTTLQLGATTPSFDLEKPIDKTFPTTHITRELVEQIIPTFIGEQWQVPPAFSAVKVDGKRAYERISGYEYAKQEIRSSWYFRSIVRYARSPCSHGAGQRTCCACQENVCIPHKEIYRCFCCSYGWC